MATKKGLLLSLCDAVELERREEEFFRKAAEEAADWSVRALFSLLAEEEARQRAGLEAMVRQIENGKDLAQACSLSLGEPRDPLSYFKDVARERGPWAEKDAGLEEAVSAAIDLERKSVRFYGERASKAGDPEEKDFFKRMVEEERAHYLSLLDMHYYLTDPEGYFMEKEKRGLDGA